MSTVIKDLGAVSAYAYAVEKGYMGTEAEFAELMADYAEVGQRAEDAAESALNSKTAAQTAATTATNKASEATTAATTAINKASEAQTSVQTASTKASEASQSASTASQKATESANSASLALTYKTDAESAKTASQTAQGLAESARDLAQGYAEDAQGYAEDAQASAESVSASASQIAQNTANILKAFPTDTASGSVASFTDGADNIPLKSLIVNIDSVQDTSSGDPSPENICPISGWEGMNLTVNETEIPISWASETGTVYGGKLDVLSGVLTVTHSYVKLLTTGWSLSGANFWRSYSTMSNTNPANVGWCTHYANETKATGNNTIIFGYSSFSGTPRIIVRDSRFTTASDFMAFLDAQDTNGTPVMIAYPLAEPIEIQLTPHEVNSLLGQNNIWADTGDTSVEYRANTQLWVQKKITEAVAAALNS